MNNSQNMNHKKKRKVTGLERYLFEEIGIEFKACLFFFCILFFYCTDRLLEGVTVANIWHMSEMILLCYAMGYFQVYLMGAFDEGEKVDIKTFIYTFLCSAVYTGISYFGSWFHKDLMLTIGFFSYMVVVYVCTFLVYKFRRDIDEKLLNEDLKHFQERQ